MLIVLEGIDGTGKETHIQLLRQKFPDLIVFKYPTRSYSMLNDYLEKKISIDPKALFLLFLADIAQDQENVRAAIKSKKHIILDRYVFSTIAYEVNGGISYENGKKLVESLNYIKPDHVILLDLDGKTSQERKKKQKTLDRYEENVKYLDEVRSRFLNLAQERFLTTSWHKIDASKSIDEVNKEIVNVLVAR
ncbi:dTMP kinase [Candidatus Micrarchaeota archaeon]|nr:dTMP kinase [Candidatus Micrarchaeota archaeon]